MRRRDLFKGSLAAGLLATLPRRGETKDGFPGLIDTNVNLFHWPFRRLPLDESEKLVLKLRALGVSTALAGSYEGIFHRDLTSANERLRAECERFPELVPVLSLNPALPGWERDLDEASLALRLHPSYHGYSLDDPRFEALLIAASECKLLVQLTVALEDPRTQPELMRVPEVDLTPLAATMAKVPAARVQLLNWRARGPLVDELATIPRLAFDCALVDGSAGVSALLERVGSERVMLGTHAPFLIPEAVLLRLYEAGMGEEALRSIVRGNAETWLGV